MTKILISQIHPKWRGIPRYHTKSADCMEVLDTAIQACLKKPSQQNKRKALLALHEVYIAISDLIKHGLRKSHSPSEYSVNDYGCWDCCMCMVVMDFNAYFYAYENSKRLTPTLNNIIKAMRSWQILSVIGYAHDIVIDPLSILTRSKVQLVMQRDFGEQGIARSQIKNHLVKLCQIESVSIVVCVNGHPVFGKGDTSHWVVVDGNANGKLMMRDPSITKIKRFLYRRIYVICVYSTPDNIEVLTYPKF